MKDINNVLNYHKKKLKEYEKLIGLDLEMHSYIEFFQKYKYHLQEYDECKYILELNNKNIKKCDLPIRSIVEDIDLDLDINWDIYDVNLDELYSVKSKNVHPYLINPRFWVSGRATKFYEPNAPVLVIQEGDYAKAYPLQILLWHGAVNDIFKDKPILITYSPLSNTSNVYSREVGENTYTFDTSGILKHASEILYDFETKSLWEAFTGKAIVGEMTTSSLNSISSSIVPLNVYLKAYSQGLVLGTDTGYIRRYSENPYAGYDTRREPFFYIGEIDKRFPAMERVVGVQIGDVYKAYPYSVLSEERVVEDIINGVELVVFYKIGMVSNLDTANIEEGREIGYTGVFSPYLKGEKLDFIPINNEIYDRQTNSRWNLLGVAIEGPLQGERLEIIESMNPFWFAWAAYYPDTLIYE
ncbi:uncharacterized protein DUF3179 [Natranaerovirga pectinivora]|uniref:Uncharacterized protein DUF3179 n=1 Tax=Natranaerovirga pectinivora TaxID=682400 RepID=A0A4R3MP43_9FIRM|nr:DUF3179 domain-containing protein [Natranaerovirga pectinivora]TCT16292.1 uncharacterized protein DUF3179 [Natranaerovirga pectinivora]